MISFSECWDGFQRVVRMGGSYSTTHFFLYVCARNTPASWGLLLFEDFGNCFREGRFLFCLPHTIVFPSSFFPSVSYLVSFSFYFSSFSSSFSFFYYSSFWLCFLLLHLFLLLLFSLFLSLTLPFPFLLLLLSVFIKPVKTYWNNHSSYSHP